ncbi:hypothetical protein MJG53_010109 [Ovis ammon polii x Ovis aries]|uniref:Uncharacterized protein n=1 Tax=Ovis ammon polii x Ovis aries TaxID=2918886 RepID=A0ACB9USW6_9CETA|nr:hypothetical protein MJG53_010109 [Ovis ammon polii x Ovis aries]
MPRRSQRGTVQAQGPVHLKRYVCPRSLGSDHVSGDLRVARARALGPRVDPPPARERRGPIGRARGSQESVKLDLDFDLELELDLEIEFDLELELDLELDLDFDLDLDFELDLALELDLDFDLELELELDQQRETRFAQSTGELGLWSMQTSRVVQGLRCPWVCGIFYTGIEPVFPASVGRFFTTGPSEMFPVPFY